MKLSPKQERFVAEYLLDLNAAAAARRAGYSAKTAEQQGSRLLSNVKGAEAIATAQQSRTQRTQVDADWVLRRLHGEAMADLAELFDAEGRLRPVADWPEVWRRGLVVGIESFEEYAGRGEERTAVGMVRKIKLSDRVKHVELIGRHVDVRAFVTRHEHTGKDGGPIQHRDVTELTDAELASIAAAGRG